MADEQARFAAWLAESRGGLAPPTPEVAAILEKMRLSGDVDVATIVTRRSSLPKEDAREIWTAIFSEVSSVLEKGEDTEALSAPKLQRYVAWSVQTSALDLVTPDASKGKTKKTGAPASAESDDDKCAEVDTDDERADEKVTKVSAQCKADMAEQGASRPDQLSRVYLSVMMGRKCGSGEHSGLSYGSHWSMAKGLKQVAKNPTGLGQKTMPQLLEAAKKTGDVMPLDKFVNKVAEAFMADPSETFWVQAGSRLLKRWNRAKTVCSNTMATVCYFDQYWEENPGRGVPEIMDHDLLREADRLACHFEDGDRPSALSRLKYAPVPPPSTAGSLASGSTWSSSLSGLTSISQRQESNISEELLSSLVGRMTEQNAQLASIAAKVAQLDADRSTPDAEGAGSMVCYYCRQKGHTAVDCPKLKAKEERQKAEAAKAAAAPGK